MDVLVVEDEALVREIVTEDLADDGFAVTEARSVEDALDLTQAAGPPEVVVTDVNLGQAWMAWNWPRRSTAAGQKRVSSS